MRLLPMAGLAIASTMMITGCAKKQTVSVPSLQQRTETVRYNKRDYSVTFKYNQSSQAYDVTVKRPAKPMSSNDKERDNAMQVAASTVSYYGCPVGYRGRPVAGSASFQSNKSWKASARCLPQT